jgi:hypothetical protein
VAAAPLVLCTAAPVCASHGAWRHVWLASLGFVAVDHVAMVRMARLCMRLSSAAS